MSSGISFSSNRSVHRHVFPTLWWSFGALDAPMDHWNWIPLDAALRCSPGMRWFPKMSCSTVNHAYAAYLMSHPQVVDWPILPHRQTALFGIEIVIWYHQASAWVWSPFNLLNSKFWWAKTRRLTAVPRFSLVISFCIQYVPIWGFYCHYLLKV